MQPRGLLILGAAAILIFAAVCALKKASAIEEKLLHSAQEALIELQRPGLHLRADGRNLEVSGRVPSQQEKKRILRRLASLPGVEKILDRMEVAPPATGHPPASFLRFLSSCRVQFSVGGAEIDSASARVLADLADSLRHYPAVQLAVIGHTDDQGDQAFNRELSLKRARRVADFLAGLGISPGRLHVQGAGSTQPLVPNENRASRAKNRRVEFRLIERRSQ